MRRLMKSLNVTVNVILWALAGSLAGAAAAHAQEAPASAPPDMSGGIPGEYRWQNAITPFDESRLERMDEALALGNEEARAGEAAREGDRLRLRSVMQAEPVAIDDSQLMGWWACRKIKVGGGFNGLVVYPYFDCRIKVKNGFLFFEKRSGSQRMSGRLYQKNAKSRLLLAAPTYNDAPQRAYMRDADENTDPQKQNAVGVLQQLADGRVRVIFPWPALEATYTVLEMKKPDA